MYQGKFTPFPHQRDALDRMENMPVFALLMRMRTGKTKVVLDDFGRLEEDGKCSDLLVIAPSGCYRTWATAIDEHVATELRRRLLVFTWESAKSSNKLFTEIAKDFLAARNRPRVLLMNIEALSTVDRARDFCKRFLRDRSRAMIVADESTALKNPKSKRTKFILKYLAPLAARKRILSGLPTPKSPLDYYSQFAFLDERILGFKDFWHFRAVHAIVKPQIFYGRKVDQIVGFRDVDLLYKKTEPYSFRVPFRPQIPSTYSVQEVELTEEQARLYDEMKQFATAKLSETEYVTATVVIAQILRLHQILCGYTKDEQGNPHEIAENRTAALLELLEEYNGKAVIWCSYDYSVRKIATALTKEYGEGSVARFWGGNVSTREEEQARFKADPKCRFIVGTPAAGRFGRDWQEADLVIYYSSSVDLEHRDQSEMRVQGMQKTRHVDYVDLIVPNTVESKILDALRKKIDLAVALTGEQWRAWVI